MSQVVTDVAEGSRRAPTPFERLLFTPAMSDWLFASYVASVLIGLSLGRSGATRDHLRVLVGVVFTVFLGGVYFYRFAFERAGRSSYLAGAIYRLLPVACMLGIYLNLRAIIPIINPRDYDESLYQLDLRIFGVEPTLFLERFSSRGVVEWFAGFYYSYFFFIASFVFVTIFVVTADRRRAIFATGFMLVTGIGELVYTLVPGLGPYAHLAHDYRGPIAGGTFYGMVLHAVSGAGALRDIFPSLHTALPSFCTLFAWRYHRRIAPIATFFCINIICATLVLRWHYGVDVLAGLTLAVTAFLLSPKLVDGYQARREAIGLGALRHW
jgi:membrane-associated phospholipid phosphatase